MSNVPKVGEEYLDDEGREFIIQEVKLGDPFGREVVGVVGNQDIPPHTFRPYSCTLQTWADIWRDRSGMNNDQPR